VRGCPRSINTSRSIESLPASCLFNHRNHTRLRRVIVAGELPDGGIHSAHRCSTIFLTDVIAPLSVDNSPTSSVPSTAPPRPCIIEPMRERDRDAAGRARSARPRDRLGRPLPPGSVGITRVSDDLNLSAQQTLIFAQQLLDDGLAFNAHEVLEAAWKNGPFAERMLWQALAQFAVGLTHIQRGNPKGARTLLGRSVIRLSAYQPEDDRVPYGIDRAGLIAHAELLLAALDAGAEPAADDLKPRLCG
jgi:hypothetical protein